MNEILKYLILMNRWLLLELEETEELLDTFIEINHKLFMQVEELKKS